MRPRPASLFRSCRASCPPRISRASSAWRQVAAPPFPPGWPAPMTDWTRMWKAAALSPPPCWPTRCSNCAPRLRPVSFLYAQPGQSQLCGMPPAGPSAERLVMSFDRNARMTWMKQEAKKRLLLLDGSWGVMIQGFKLGEEDFRGRASAIIHRAQGQQRSSHADQAGDDPRYRRAISGSGRRFHRNQHLQFQFHQPGRLWPGPSGRAN